MAAIDEEKTMERCFVWVFVIFFLSAPPAYAENATDYFHRALNSSSAGEKIENFSKALEVNPKLSEAYARRGMLYFFKEKYDRVIDDYKNYVMLVPDDAEGFRMLGMGYLYKGKYDAAISTFTMALKVDPNLTSALCYRAEAYRRKGDYAKSIFDADMSIRLEGNPRVLSDVYITRAKVYRQMGEYQKSVRDIQSALRVDPRSYFYRNVADYASMDDLQWAGLIAMIAIAFVFIFDLKLRAPEKKE
jgi:tetratricopeptide (TPR) repeat protein